jgi:hypothetical protein
MEAVVHDLEGRFMQQRPVTGGRRACLLGVTVLAATAAMAGSASSAPPPEPPPPPPSPKGPCPGSLIESIQIREGSAINRVGTGQLLGWFNLYYDSATGENCARTVSSSFTSGKFKTMDATIHKCREKSAALDCTVVKTVSDQGRYRFYAGPVKIAARRTCIFAYGYIEFVDSRNRSHWGFGSTIATNGQRKASHCG